MPIDIPELAIELVKAIDADWALCDKSDEVDYYILVNEDREEHPSLVPKKILIKEMELEGYIRFDEEKSDLKDKKRDYMEFLDGSEPVWLVFFYKVTTKGRDLINT